MKKHKKRLSKAARVFGYIAAIFVNVVILYIVNNLLDWNLTFITEKLNESLYYINLSIYVTIAVNFAYIIYDNGRFKSGAELVTNVFSFVATYFVYKNYPFDFNAVFSFDADLIAKICMICAMVGIVIAAVVNFVRLFKPKDL